MTNARFRSRPPSGCRKSAVLVGLCLILGFPAWVAAQPRGDFRIWAEERQENWGPYGVSRNWEGSRLHSEGVFFPVNAGAWNFLIDVSQRGQELRFQGSDIPTSAGRLFLQMGDFVEADPRQDPLRPEFEQDVWIRGGSVKLRRENLTYGVRAGVLTVQRGLFGWGRSPVFSNTYGATVAGGVREQGLWKVDLDRQEATPARQGSHLARFFLGSQPEAGWAWLGQARVSRLEDGSWGNSLIGGGRFERSNFYAAGHVRRISPDFQGLGLYTDPHRNEWGTRVEASYRSPDHVFVGTSVDWGKDIEPRTMSVTPETRLVTRFFVSTPIAGPFLYRGDVGLRNRSTNDPDSLLVDQRAMLWSSALSWHGPRGSAEVGLNRSLNRDPSELRQDWVENRYSGHFLHQFGRMVRGEIRAWVARRDLLDGTWASTERKIETQWYLEPRSYQRGWLRVGRSFQEANETAFSRDQWEVSVGWTQPLPWELSLDLETTQYLAAGDYGVDRARYNFRLARRFQFGGGRLRHSEELPEFGVIRGRVFMDLNRNGYIDSGEPGIPDQVLKLGSGPEVRTDADGYYEFRNAATVMEWVTFDYARLPTRYLAPAETRFSAELFPGEELERHFPVKLAASVGGRVVVSDGLEARGAPDVLVRVVGTHHDVFTDEDGKFWIAGLEPGEATLELIEWSLPEDSEVPETRMKTVTLRGGRPIDAGVFVLKKKEKKVLQIFRPGTSR